MKIFAALTDEAETGILDDKTKLGSVLHFYRGDMTSTANHTSTNWKLHLQGNFLSFYSTEK